MPAPVGRSPLATAVSAALFVCVLAFVGASSSVAALDRVATPARWAALLVLLVLAAAWAVERRGALASPRVLAAAGAFLGLALLSSLWSVDPGLTVARVVTVVVLFAIALALAAASAGAPRAVERLLGTVLAAATTVATGGLVLLLADRAAALQEATYNVSARYQGLGENPNTIALLLALALPIAVWFTLTHRRPVVRAAAGAAVLLFFGSIGASGSRGALAAGVLGVLVVAAIAPQPRRLRLAAAATTAALVPAALALGAIGAPAGLSALPPPPDTGSAGYLDAEATAPLSFELGTEPRVRGLLGSSGRVSAWAGAVEDGARRPVLGYGFGTEERAFVDRYTLFQGDRPENSYLGTYLQLGVIGLAVFLALVAAVLAPMARAARRPVVGVCLAVVVTGLALAAVQSYVYSVGNVGTATFWICAFLGVVAARRAAPAGWAAA